MIKVTNALERFHCVDEVEIVACAIEGVCTAVKVCESKCIEKELGATCVVATSSTVTERDDIEEMKKKNQHKECADDGKSVLMCRYGFCSIDEYCPKGTKCRKNCNCCRPNHQKREIEDGDEDVHDDVSSLIEYIQFLRQEYMLTRLLRLQPTLVPFLFELPVRLVLNLELTNA